MSLGPPPHGGSARGGEMAERTFYSEMVPGAAENYEWPARFDKTRGTIGVSQQDEHGQWKDRVLLSRRQGARTRGLHPEALSRAVGWRRTPGQGV